jgi:transposase InsO family protein
MGLRRRLPHQRRPHPRARRLPDRYNFHRPHKALGGIPPAKRLAERTNPTAAYT